MFRFLHTADLHLDSPLRGLASREGAPSDELRGASRRAFENLVRLAVDESVDFVVIAGDVYDRDWRDYQTALFFRGGMNQLREAGIPVYLISGNHDAASVISRKLSLPDNVTQFSSQAPQTVEPPQWPVAIHGMSFPNRAVEENLVPRYPDPVAGKFNLGILHTSLAGAEGHDTYAPCSVDDLVGKGYDYWALGHIHLPAVIHESPWIVFPGNLQGRHARECGPRGCRLIEVNDDLEVADCAWRELDVARWARIEVPAAGVDAFEDLVSLAREAMGGAVEDAGDRLLALRIAVTGATPLHGRLHGRPDRFEAEMQAAAEEFGEGAVWIEKVILETRGTVSLEELAARDALTRVVVEALDEASAGGAAAALPPEVTTMLDVLPPDLKEELAGSWGGTGRRDLIEDACALVLDRLTTKGGEA